MRVCENEDCVKMRLLRKWKCVEMRLLRKWEVVRMRYCYGKSSDVFHGKPWNHKKENTTIIKLFVISPV